MRASIYGAGRAADHTNRIGAVHAGICDHEVIECVTVADKAGIVVVAFCTCVNASIATHTSVKVDEHSCRSLDEAVLNQYFQGIGINFG